MSQSVEDVCFRADYSRPRYARSLATQPGSAAVTRDWASLTQNLQVRFPPPLPGQPIPRRRTVQPFFPGPARPSAAGRTRSDAGAAGAGDACHG